MNKIITILQARFSSTRLPGKVLLPILDEPMLMRQVARIKCSKLHGRIIIATSINKEDEAIVDCCQQNSVDYYCGPLDDVLDRFYQATKIHQPEHIVRLTGDCPLIDPAIIDKVIKTHLEGNFDYTSNALHPTYPDGLDVEIFRFSALQTAWKEAVLPSDREHVTPFIYRNEHRFRIGHVYHEVNLSELRWTVDWQVDFDLVKTIYEKLFLKNNQFSMNDILDFLEQSHPELKTMNTNYERNEGMKLSLHADQIFLKAHYESEML